MEVTKTMTAADKQELKIDIKMFSILSFLFSLALLALIFIPIFLLLVFGVKVSEGFEWRAAGTVLVMFAPFFYFFWNGFLKFLDIRAGKKLSITSHSHEVIKKKDSVKLSLRDKQRSFAIDEDIAPSIDPDKPIRLEIAPISKRILFISHGDENLLIRD